MTAKVSRYKELDALRGIAAMAVVFFHFTMDYPGKKTGFELGVTGVDLFFIISGFVIFMTIGKVSSSKEFFVNRFTRLFPVYWTCVTFTYILKAVTPQLVTDTTPVSFARYLANLTMFQYYLRFEDIDGPYWTMLVEMLFYISIAILFSLKKMKYIVEIGAAILGIALINDLLLQHYFHFLIGVHKAFPLFTHFPLFFAGIVFYKIMHLNKGDKQQFYLYGCIALAYITKLALADNGGPGVGFLGFPKYAMCLAFYFLLFILFVNGLLKFIVNRVTLFFGKISFPLYLIHHYLSIRVMIPMLLKHTPINYWIICLITLTTIISLATIVSYTIETPCERKWNDWLRIRLGLPLRGASKS
ncbi:MAG: acyltransferase [Sphingobacteriales bacterium]|nr:acyltransferase [Sphingobacteriales bacterium]MBI3718940.1 acyltransferase [Sphingobacteriales bacterium]